MIWETCQSGGEVTPGGRSYLLRQVPLRVNCFCPERGRTDRLGRRWVTKLRLPRIAEAPTLCEQESSRPHPLGSPLLRNRCPQTWQPATAHVYQLTDSKGRESGCSLPGPLLGVSNRLQSGCWPICVLSGAQGPEPQLPWALVVFSSCWCGTGVQCFRPLGLLSALRGPTLLVAWPLMGRRLTSRPTFLGLPW